MDNNQSQPHQEVPNLSDINDLLEQDMSLSNKNDEGSALVRQAWTQSATTSEMEKYIKTGIAPDEMDGRTRLVSGMARELAMALGARLETAAEEHIDLKNKSQHLKEFIAFALKATGIFLIAAFVFSFLSSGFVMPFIAAFGLMLFIWPIIILLKPSAIAPLLLVFKTQRRVKPVLTPQDRFPIVKKAIKGLVSKDVEGIITTAIDDVYAISQATARHPDIFDPTEAAEIGEMIGETLLAGTLLTQIDAYRISRQPLLQSKHLTTSEKAEQLKVLEELKGTRSELDERVKTTALRFSLIRGELLQLEAEALQGTRLQGSVENMLIEIRSLRDAMKTVNSLANGQLQELNA